MYRLVLEGLPAVERGDEPKARSRSGGGTLVIGAGRLSQECEQFAIVADDQIGLVEVVSGITGELDRR